MVLLRQHNYCFNKGKVINCVSVTTLRLNYTTPHHSLEHTVTVIDFFLTHTVGKDEQNDNGILQLLFKLKTQI